MLNAKVLLNEFSVFQKKQGFWKKKSSNILCSLQIPLHLQLHQLSPFPANVQVPGQAHGLAPGDRCIRIQYQSTTLVQYHSATVVHQHRNLVQQTTAQKCCSPQHRRSQYYSTVQQYSTTVVQYHSTTVVQYHSTTVVQNHSMIEWRRGAPMKISLFWTCWLVQQCSNIDPYGDLH